MNEQNTSKGIFDLVRFIFFERLFQASERGAGSANTAIASFGILLKGKPTRETAFKATSIKFVQEMTMIVAVHPKCRGIIIRECPADVIMHAYVVNPGSFRMNLESCGKCL